MHPWSLSKIFRDILKNYAKHISVQLKIENTAPAFIELSAKHLHQIAMSYMEIGLYDIEHVEFQYKTCRSPLYKSIIDKCIVCPVTNTATHWSDSLSLPYVWQLAFASSFEVRNCQRLVDCVFKCIFMKTFYKLI